MSDLTFRPRRNRTGWIVGGGLVIALLILATQVCLPAWIGSGVLVARCPDGELRQTLRLALSSAIRGGPGWVRAGATAHYTLEGEENAYQTPVRRLDVELFLVDAAGKEQPISMFDPREHLEQASDQALQGSIAVPTVPDGDYLLRAKVKTPIDKGQIDLPVALYAPAKIHLLTDRPLYQPGQTVKMRAVALRAGDLTPLDHRPGRWMVEDPSGETVFEEKAAAGDFGVVAGSFPLDAAAPTGTWTVRWVSGAHEGRASIQVEPFRLPRFRVEAEAARAVHLPGDRPRVRGRVVYSSGAPVAGASIDLSWSVDGAWPPPTSWLEGALPKKATAGPSGAFELDLPVVPADLVGRATLYAAIAATDPAGDRVEGAVSLLLSKDAIAVSEVTELGAGLVDGFNNRLYLRVTSAAGAPLPGAALTVKRAWEPSDPGIATTTDEDGVAALQIDPGPPVNVVIPPLPVRPPPKRSAVQRGEARDLISGDAPRLADQVALDGWTQALEPCARFVEGSDALEVGVAVDPSGAVTRVSSDLDPLSRCAAQILRGRRLPPGPDRLLSVQWNVEEADLAAIEVEVEGAPAALDELAARLSERANDARPCLRREAEGALPRLLVWATQHKDRKVALRWVRDPSAEDLRGVSAAEAACVEARFAGVELAEAAEADQIGTARLAATPAPSVEAIRPQATTMLGYELTVTAAQGDEQIGRTTIRIAPGEVPPLRMRATPVLAAPGQAVKVELIRGPGFSGKLPDKLWLTQPGRKPIEAKLDPKTRSAELALPADAKGWFQVEWAGARAVVFVQGEAELALALRPERDRYAPGEHAKLILEAKLGGRGVAAAVGLFGVDESLGQLAALPGPDAMSGLRPPVVTPAPAFGVLDGQALSMGRIRGKNAAQATVIRVTGLPQPEDLDTRVDAAIYGQFDPIEPLTDRFYLALAELHRTVREWEKQAPAGEQMTPPTMARLWSSALDRAAKSGTPIEDAFGRRLSLSRLPPDLLALTAPHAVVIEGTRLPEDVEDWARWVQKERP